MRKSIRRTAALILVSIVVGVLGVESALRAQLEGAARNVAVDPKLFGALQYRSLGFSRGGRVTAVTGVVEQPLVYYFGSTGGGVWKTTDAGVSWANVSDGFLEAGSIGAIAVAESDANVVYVGTGSAQPRGNVSPGVGIYKSTDAGRTWKHVGLRDAGLISRLRVHPKDPDLVYAAVLGNIFGSGQTRGIFRSKDGGATWTKVLFASENTGASDLSMDATNPRILYAGLWSGVRRSPWSIDSGGMDGGVFKSSDGGDTWTRLERGLPNDAMVGKVAVSVSPADPNRVWALIEAAGDRGGVYRSDDAGGNWTRVNAQRSLLQRAWYYIKIYADSMDRETVYGLNTSFFKSTDGGRTFQSIQVPHGDNHDLWINPHDNSVLINSNDGGANVSFNGGRSWSTQMNQPTAEIYRVTVDTRFPFRVYGAQQDNSTISVASVSAGGPGGLIDWYAVGGGESGHIAVDPRNPNIVYAGSYGGTITKYNHETRLLQSIRPYPDMQTGQRAADMKYRFQWNAPIRLSPHNPDIVYHTSQYVHRSRDGGRTWEVISPDLTRNDKATQDYSGGKGITRDNTGTEVFGTVFALEESPKIEGLLWAGSDDGRLHISRDNGKTWTDATPKMLPDRATINMIDLSGPDPGRAFIAVHRYRENDFAPYIFRTSDYGQTWQQLTDGKNGIPADHFVRVVREDPDRRGLLYAGTEFGMYVSFDDGARWQKFQLNLPVTPVTDLLVHQKALVVATQGRAFWMIDDLSPLHQLTEAVMTSRATLFQPRDAYRSGPQPASIFYYFADEPKEPVRIEIMDPRGAVVATFAGRPEGQAGESDGQTPAGREGQPASRVSVKSGLNRFEWNGRYASLFEIPRGIVMWGGGPGAEAGPKVVPGRYQVRVSAGQWSQMHPLLVKPDPRAEASQADYEEQDKLARQVAARVKTLYDALLILREAKQQARQIGERLQNAGHGDEAVKAARALGDRLAPIEGELTQLQGEGGQDALNFPGRLDNQFVALYSAVVGVDRKPGPGFYERFKELNPQLDRLLGQLRQMLQAEVASFNDLVRRKEVPPLILKTIQ